MTLQIEKGNAVKAYNNGDDKIKSLLEELFGKKTFQPVTDRIKTYEDACVELGIDADLGISCSKSGAWKDIDNITAYAKLLIIAKALQEGWQPDWSNSNERKWRVWFEYKPGVGFVVAVTFCDDTCTGTCCGSRLCFPTSELARYFGEQFLDLHRIVLEK